MSSSSSSSSDSSDAIDLEAMANLYNNMGQRVMRNLQAAQASSSAAPRRRATINRDRVEGHARLYRDYFAEAPVYNDRQFRVRFRMRKHVFLRIVAALQSRYPYFQQRSDASGRVGLSPLQKCTAALRMLAYGVPADAVDDYVRLGKTTAQECLTNFVSGVVSVLGPEYLRRPNAADTERLLSIGAARGFPGMLGSIDCMHWEWRNCPTAYKGQYARGDHDAPTIILEAVASWDTWIWHAFFGVPGTCNDINTLDRSPVFNDICEGRAPPVNFTVNGRHYDLGYYLADGIYPPYATFVQSIRLPQSEKAKLFATKQEACRKDVERAFGILQSRFAIVRGGARMFKVEQLGEIMMACIVMHNMIVEDERDGYGTRYEYDSVGSEASNWHPHPGPTPSMAAYIQNRGRVRDSQRHHALRHDLMEHIWALRGNDN